MWERFAFPILESLVSHSPRCTENSDRAHAPGWLPPGPGGQGERACPRPALPQRPPDVAGAPTAPRAARPCEGPLSAAPQSASPGVSELGEKCPLRNHRRHTGGHGGGARGERHRRQGDGRASSDLGPTASACDTLAVSTPGRWTARHCTLPHGAHVHGPRDTVVSEGGDKRAGLLNRTLGVSELFAGI